MIFPHTLVVNRYRADYILGRGGMGEVWMCFDTILNRNVVLKIVNPQLAEAKPQSTQIFIDEGCIGGALVGHPNVVAVFDILNVKTTEPILALVMEYVEGMSCSEWIELGVTRIEPFTKHILNLMVAMETCKALTYAHRKSILHRDIKPLNIFISKYGITKLGDFGIARYVDAVTREHTVWNFRSPAYSAPEQWRDEKPSIETDIYQLGCTFYHLFTGKLPFEASNVAALIQMHLTATSIEPNLINTHISANLSSLILTCLSKEKEKRPDLWQISDAIAHDLQQKYSMYINFNKDNDDLINEINAITEFKIDEMKENGGFVWHFADYNEAISEAFELLMLPDVEVSLKKTIPPKPKNTTSATAK